MIQHFTLRFRLLARGVTVFALLSSLAMVGCGDDDGDFLVRGPGQQIALVSSGSLSFQFYQAQAAAVSAQANELEFEFFDAQGQPVKEVVLPYDALVTVSDVPVTASEVSITVYDPDGAPLQSLTDEVAVVPGKTTTVDLSDAVEEKISLQALEVSPGQLQLTLNSEVEAAKQLSLTGLFDNGSSVALDPTAATYQVRPDGVVSVDTQGRVTALAPGAASIVVRLTVEDVSQTATVGVAVGYPAE